MLRNSVFIILIILINILLLNDLLFLEKDNSINNDLYEYIEENKSNEFIEDTYININVNNIGYISIKKINLIRYLYSIDSNNNKVSKNIEVLKVNNNLLVLASHSGKWSNAYFNDLYKLNIGDEISINYLNNTGLYVLDNIYEIDKDGSAELKYKNNKDTLIMITCNQKDKTKQVIYVSYRKE